MFLVRLFFTLVAKGLELAIPSGLGQDVHNETAISREDNLLRNKQHPKDCSIRKWHNNVNATALCLVYLTLQYRGDIVSFSLRLIVPYSTDI